MQRGFVTIATGEERYHRMARTLLRSYRQNCDEPKPFALITDHYSVYAEEFDNVVVLEDPSNSWMDKLTLLTHCPYEENIFIDADCLVYQDINFLWDQFCCADDFSCFGKALPLDSWDGWFYPEAAQVYPIHFITHLHGMLYFIRPGNTTQMMHRVCLDIVNNYHRVRYKSFNDTPADEPVFALAMAVMNLKPVARKPIYYCFVPYATHFQSNYLKRKVLFSNPKDGDVTECCVVHWGNQNTNRAQYRFDAHIVNDLSRQPENYSMKYKLKLCLLYHYEILLIIYRIGDCALKFKSICSWLLGRIKARLSKYL